MNNEETKTTTIEAAPAATPAPATLEAPKAVTQADVFAAQVAKFNAEAKAAKAAAERTESDNKWKPWLNGVAVASGVAVTAVLAIAIVKSLTKSDDAE